MNQNRINPNRILIPAFISGACAMVVELAGGRVMAPYLGSTIYTWASVIGLVLGALSAGYYIGGKLADKYNDRSHLSYIFFLAAICTVIIPLLIGILAPLSLLLDLASASILVSLTLVPASIFFGMVSPYAIKLTSEQGKEGKGSGRVFAISTLGSIVGVLGTGFILVPNMALSHIFILAAVLMIISATMIGRTVKKIDLAMFILFAIPISFLGFSPPVEGELISSSSSEYFEINVFNTSYFGSPSLLLMLDSSASSAISEDGSLPFSYMNNTRIGYELVSNPERALVLGSAAGTQVEDLKSHYPNAYIDGVEIDRKTVEVGEQYFGHELDERTDIIIDDARRFVKTTDRNYDLILMDLFKGKTVPYHVASVEFFQELKGIMDSEGVLVINIILPIEGENPGLLDLFYNTLSEEFTNVLILPVKDDPYIRQNCVIIATNQDVSAFRETYSEKIYPFIPKTDQVITDDLNPADVYVMIG